VAAQRGEIDSPWENTMKRFLLITTALSIVAAAHAEQRQHASFTIPAQNTKFNISQNLIVDDVPGHIMRLFDTTATPPPGTFINGVEIITVYARGTGENINGQGIAATGFLEHLTERLNR
jgi:hypothetical protein